MAPAGAINSNSKIGNPGESHQCRRARGNYHHDRRCAFPSLDLLKGVVGAGIARGGAGLTFRLGFVLVAEAEAGWRSSTGGRRSFSISDLRLIRPQYPSARYYIGKKRPRWDAYASSKVLMAFLIPSAPSASVPYGNLDEPEMLLSSDTRSDSSLLSI